MAEKAGNTTSTSNNRARSDRESRENECGDVMPSIEEESCSKKSLCNGGK